MSPLEMMSMFGPMFVVLPMLLWFLVIGPLILYPVARWRAARETYMDPQLGMKVALHYFKLLAFQMLLLGAAVLIWTIVSKSTGDKGTFYRAAFGFLVPAGIVFAAHMVLLKKTNDESFTGVRRLFLGYNLLVTGLLGFLALMFGFQALFAKGSSGDGGRVFLAAILVYCSAWGGIGVLFAREVLGAGSSVPPQNLAPPSASATPTAATPGLPPLAAPSFPPLDQR